MYIFQLQYRINPKKSEQMQQMVQYNMNMKCLSSPVMIKKHFERIRQW